ncbi:hypothetical protein D1BOALGB6SA_5146 [Olavius sp. associated proteobacterium Delta 1]|nr:hypothetical protein D1BOALGB6SA_5146 [Olavius sp. associated proteobacterium Delta 1]
MVWIILFIVAIGLSLIIWRSAKGPVHTLRTLEIPIKDLLRRGYNDGSLVINVHHSKYFLQLRKYIYKPGNYGIKLCFPNAKWSEQVFVKLTDFCKNTGIEYSIGKEIAEEPLEFLHVDFGKDVTKAHNTIKNIILKVFEFDDSIKLFVRLENAAVDDELIDS